MSKKYYRSATSKSPLSGAVLAGNTLYVSGQLGIDPSNGKMQEGDRAQTLQAMENLSAQLAQAGMTLEDVVKTMIYVAADTNVAEVNEAYASYFGENLPARSLVRAAFPNTAAKVEIEAIAVTE